MKIVKSSGCTAFYTRVEDKDLTELTNEEKEALFLRLILILKKSHGIDSAINSILDELDYADEDGGYCDQCGDHVYRQLYDLEELEIALKITSENESS